jgi:copper chaperone
MKHPLRRLKTGRGDAYCSDYFIRIETGRRREWKVAAIKIAGMSCQHCVMAVTKTLGGIEGIRDVHVDLEKGMATFIEDKPVDLTLIRQRIKKAGFDVVE